ncbi:Chloride channel protein 2, partial [Branchiostoma belcheri]
ADQCDGQNSALRYQNRLSGETGWKETGQPTFSEVSICFRLLVLAQVRRAIEGTQEDQTEVPRRRKMSNDIPMSNLDHAESSSDEGEDNRLMSDSSEEGATRQEFRFTVTDVDAEGIEDSKV